MSQPISHSSDSHHLGTAQSASSSDSHHLGAAQTSNSSHSHHKSVASDSDKDSNTPQINPNMVMDQVKSLENKIRQESEQLKINRVKHESDLRNMSQQYESQINKLIHTHQQQVSDFEAQIQAKHNEMLALKNQLSTFNFQSHSYTTQHPTATTNLPTTQLYMAKQCPTTFIHRQHSS